MSTTPFPLPIMLDVADRKALRARAHHLDPVIMIGEAGLTRAVLDETDRALRAHELIKVRVLGDDRAQRQAMSTEICSALGCTAVQSIGKLLVLYRPRPIEDGSGAHVPKKRAAQGATATATPARRGAARKPQPAARKGVGAMKAMKAKPATTNSASARPSRPAKSSVGARAPGASALATEGKRTALGARKRTPALHGSASATTQGPSRLRGKDAVSPRGRRDRAKKA
ncbi:MAG TPA: YhbY family RNA-binding protein [Zeimonas sp.]